VRVDDGATPAAISGRRPSGLAGYERRSDPSTVPDTERAGAHHSTTVGGSASALAVSLVVENAMPEIRIAYDLPAFKYAFTWTMTEAEAAKLLDSQLASIAAGGLDRAAVLNSLAGNAPTILPTLKDAVQVRGMHVALTAWALQQNAGHPELPGRMLDYLPTHDFEVIIAGAKSGEISAIIKAEARNDFTGSA
jgi:hypothetical protein